MARKMTNAVGQLLFLVCACDSGGFAYLRGIALLREERVTTGKGDLTGFVFSIDGMVYGLRRHLDNGTTVRIHPNEGTEKRLVDFGGGLRASDARQGQLQSEAALYLDPETATIQVLLDTLDNVDARFCRVTYLNADHLAPTWSPDEGFPYYLTRDSLTGFVQLFRFDTRC